MEREKVRRIFRYIIYRLTADAQQKHGQKVAELVFGVATSLGDHDCENGEGKPSDIAEELYFRKKDDADVIRHHGNCGNDFEQVAAENVKAMGGR